MTVVSPLLQRLRELADHLESKRAPIYAFGHVLRAAEIRQVVALVEAAQRLHHFLWEEKSTNEPPEDLRDGYAALESHEDYDREEVLTEELGAALVPFAGSAPDTDKETK